ncbi:MAG: high light inducible protein [Timaviella obliquedivisa GSE-PSE-MK23-08B]|nr:high light inducible protein [Timaviella obliquedivisa GSE-PSE-MK23-08B]
MVNEVIAEDAGATVATAKIDSAPLNLEYNGVDRNAWIFGFNPQQELWNGRLAMLGFVAYLLWDIGGFSVLRDVLRLVG